MSRGFCGLFGAIGGETNEEAEVASLPHWPRGRRRHGDAAKLLSTQWSEDGSGRAFVARGHPELRGEAHTTPADGTEGPGSTFLAVLWPPRAPSRRERRRS